MFCALHESVLLLFVDVKALKNPVAHTSHLGWVVTEPIIFVYLPGGHLVWAAHESVRIMLFDVDALKNPDTHASQSTWALVVPAFLVYLPGGHLMLRAAHESVLVVLFDVEALKNPGTHSSHLGGAVIEPDAAVYLPGGHLECAMHRSIDDNDVGIGGKCGVHRPFIRARQAITLWLTGRQ